MRQPRRFPLLVTAVSALALLVLPTTLSASTASAAPSPGYTASYIPVAGTAGTGSVAVDPATDTVYIIEEASAGTSGSLIVVNGSSHAVVATIPLSGLPLGIAVNSVTNTVYVDEYLGAIRGQIEVIDGASDTVSATISVSEGYGVIAVDSVTNTIYVVGSTAPGQLLAIDGSSNAVAETISSGGSNPTSIAVDEATDVIWVDNGGSTIAAINGANGLLISTVSVTGAGEIAVNPSTDTVYVGTSNGITVIDGAAYTITTTIPVSLLTGFAVDPSADVVFAVVSTAAGLGTAVIDGATNTVVDVLSGGVSDQGGQWASLVYGYGPAVDTATGVAYVVSVSPEFPGLWAIAPSASNGISPLLSGTASSAAVTTGSQVSAAFVAGGLPAPTITETGPLPAGVTFNPTTGVLSGAPAAGTAGVYSVTFTASNGVAPDYSLPYTLTVTAPPAAYYTPVGPVRVLDTRNGTGGFGSPVGPGGTISLQVTGVDGVPSSGVTAVVLNVTVTSPTAYSYVTVYPDGIARPLASNLNFYAGNTIANLVTVPVGSDGKVDFYNAVGSTELIADLQGYYTTSGAGASYVPAGPTRVLDTRNGTGAPQAPIGQGGSISLQVEGADGIPATGVTAVVLNLTATDATAPSYVTAYPDGQTPPLASNLNFHSGENIANLVTVPVGADGKVDFYNSAGSTDLVADLEGYYTTSGTGSLFVAAGPTRLLDTRNGTGAPQALIGQGAWISLQVEGVQQVPATGVTAVVLNLTATQSTASSYITAYPDGETTPLASNLNFTAGETIANMAVVPVGTDGEVDFYNAVGSTDLIADLAGYFTSP
jgi:DNA-binding beta-propeller fold protein YncE